MDIADEVGVQAVTIRGVARRANVAPMSMYTYIDDKEHLLDLMYADLMDRLYADAGHPTWQAELVSMCHQVRQTLLEHPRWATLFSRPAPPLAVALRERLLALMAADGIPVEEAFWSITHGSLMSIGYALVELSFRTEDGSSILATRLDRLKAWAAASASAAANPATRAAVANAQRFDLSTVFARAVRVYVASLEQQRGSSLSPLP